jgi:hypothetical protein
MLVEVSRVIPHRYNKCGNEVDPVEVAAPVEGLEAAGAVESAGARG